MSGQHPADEASSRPPSDQQTQPHQPQQSQSAPFQQQFEHLVQSQYHPAAQHDVGHYGHRMAFDMATMAAALPQTSQQSMASRTYVNPDPSAGLPPPNQYPSQQPMYVQTQRPQFADPTMMARMQQQMMAAQSPSAIQRQQGYHMGGQMPYSPIDAYGYGMSPMQFSPVDPRFSQQQFMVMPGGLPPDLSQFARRGSAVDNAPIPNFPRGPPRKPKQSGHALWVGNLPPQAMVTDLKDHFSRDATNDIDSVFLIAKSNCAFVNYRTESACVAAMNRFHDSRFHGVRLVCRLRRGSTATSATPTAEQSIESTSSPKPAKSPPAAATDDTTENPSPTIARSQSEQSLNVAEGVAGPPAPTGERVPEKYFIVKSLTAQDLEASVRNGTWSTQSHNESLLNNAFEQADNVFLIFSANKSGEYFGYARMASPISGEPINLSSLSSSSSSSPPASASSTEASISPQSIPTPATATAPKGRIIDDSARGTIFWEADHSSSDDDEVGGDNTPETKTPKDPNASTSSTSNSASASSSGQNWGKQFQIEWISTNRLPFYRTRGLRNPWNANREVKIARDGTELEPSVGRRLVGMFHRVGGLQGQVQAGPGAMGAFR